MLRAILVSLAGRYVFSLFAAVLEGAGAPLAARVPLYVVLAFLVLVVAMWWCQESLLYRPEVPRSALPFAATIKTPSDNPRGMRSPEEHGIPYENVTLIAEDGVMLHAWFIPSPTSPTTAPTLLFSHENAGNIGLRLQEFSIIHAHLGCNVLLYDYRGYGYSQKAPVHEEGLLKDARAAWRWLQDQSIDTARIVLYGRSLGGAVTVRLARELCEADQAPLPAGVILGNTFTSIEELVGSLYWWLNWPMLLRRLLRLQWRSIEHIRHIRVPMLLLVSLKDEIVPSHHTRRLKEAAVGAPYVEMHVVEEGHHNDLWLKGGSDYLLWLRDFLESVPTRKGVVPSSHE